MKNLVKFVWTGILAFFTLMISLANLNGAINGYKVCYYFYSTLGTVIFCLVWYAYYIRSLRNENN
jgi:hypothetical protein